MAATLAQTDVVQGSNLGSPTQVFKKSVTYSAGNPTAALSDTSIGTDLSGIISSVHVVFGGTAPNSLTVTIKNTDGGTLVTGTVTASGALTISGSPTFVGGLTVACSGNSTNSATATIIITYFVRP